MSTHTRGGIMDLDKDIDLLGVVFMSYIEDLCNEKDDKDQ